ncbi:MAG: hypothetical protein KC983_09285 [Phycisphaerales bacterium]|nr:hypothetical protein [Phycisphaerales bacterium]
MAPYAGRGRRSMLQNPVDDPRYDPGMSMPTRPRIILLGASNVTRCISTIVETARLIVGAGTPVDIHAAIGHGRSYVHSSSLLTRTLPAITESPLWLAVPPPPVDDRPTFALLTDVGNDIMYGKDVATIVASVETCLDRLEERNATIVMTNIPMPRVECITPMQFRIVKSLFFPGYDVAFEQAVDDARAISHRLDEIARARNIPIIMPDGAWYGADPIHIMRSRSIAAWSSILSVWRPHDEPVFARSSFRRWLFIRPARGSRWSFLGRPRETPQPARRLADGSTLSLW